MPALSFKFGRPPDLEAAKGTLLTLRERLDRHEADLRTQALERKEQELFVDLGRNPESQKLILKG